MSRFSLFQISDGKAELEKVEASLVALSLRSFSQMEDFFRFHFSQRTQSGPLFSQAELRLALEQKTALVRGHRFAMALKLKPA